MLSKQSKSSYIMRIVNKERCADRSQSSVGSIEERVGGLVVLRSYPLALEYTPQCLRNVEVRRVRREVEEEHPSAFPNGHHPLHGFAAVDAGVVKHDDSAPSPWPKGQPAEEVGQLVGGYASPRCEAFVSVVPCGHAEYVDTRYLLGRDMDFLSRKLPSVWDVAFRADVALVRIVEAYPSVIRLSFKFLQLLGPVLVELRRGDSPRAFPYTLISCANAHKKRLKVESPASFPLDCRHASRALFTLCRSCSIERRTAYSSEQSTIGLRPLPGRVSRPLTPSFSYRLSLFLTACCSSPVLSPTSVEDSPAAFRSKDRHLILKQCFSPWRYPLSSSNRRASLSSNRTAFLVSNVVRTRITRIAA